MRIHTAVWLACGASFAFGNVFNLPKIFQRSPGALSSTLKPTTVRPRASVSNTRTTSVGYTRTSSPSSCLSVTITVTSTKILAPTTITYPVNSAATTVLGAYLTSAPQIAPETYYPDSALPPINITLATTTSTVLETPTFLLPRVTVTAPTPSGFVPIRSSLPDAAYSEGINKRDAVADVVALAPRCTSTIVKTSIVTAPRITKTAVTTLSGTEYDFDQTTFDGVGFSSFLKTYTGPTTTTVTGPSTSTTFLQTVYATVTLPTQTITPTKTVYAACATNNVVNVYHNSTNGTDYKFLTVAPSGASVGLPLLFDDFPTPYDCCNAVNQLGGAIAYAWAIYPTLGKPVCFGYGSQCGELGWEVAGFGDVLLDGPPASIGNVGCGKVTSVGYRYVGAVE